MTTRATIAILSVAAALLLTSIAPHAQAANPDDLLKVAIAYLDRYATRVSGVSLEEQYTITDVSGGRMSTPQHLQQFTLYARRFECVAVIRDRGSGSVIRDPGFVISDSRTRDQR